MPFACLRLVNPAMSITAGLGILRLSVAAGDVAVMDTREPSRTKYPVVLHAGPMRCGVCIYVLYCPPLLHSSEVPNGRLFGQALMGHVIKACAFEARVVLQACFRRVFARWRWYGCHGKPNISAECDVHSVIVVRFLEAQCGPQPDRRKTFQRQITSSYTTQQS